MHLFLLDNTLGIFWFIRLGLLQLLMVVLLWMPQVIFYADSSPGDEDRFFIDHEEVHTCLPLDTASDSRTRHFGFGFRLGPDQFDWVSG